MEMSYSQDVRQSVKHSLSQTQKLEPKQSVTIQQGLLLRQRELVESVHGIRYSPRAACPKCSHQLTDLEILKGFRDDPTDYSTQCPKCHERFLPLLYASTQYSSVRLPYYCPAQTLEQIKDMRSVPLEEFKTQNAAVYNSALVHFGGLKQAFEQLGLTYEHEAELDWRKNVGPFLGKLPDTVIAKLLGAKVGEIRRMRKAQGIRKFRHRDLLEARAEVLPRDDGANEPEEAI